MSAEFDVACLVDCARNIRADERERVAFWLERASGIESGCECECECECDSAGHDVDCGDCWPCRIQDCVDKIRNSCIEGVR